MTESSSAATCPRCGASTAASGKFCSSCGAPLAGAACASCRTPLSPGAKFCHRCGTAVGATAPASEGSGNALPWAVAAIALLALVALVAGQRFSRSSASQAADASQGDASQAVAPFAGGANGNVRAPDISQMTPDQRAERLYDRMMGAFERGQMDTVRMFAPMATEAYQMLDSLTLDQRYDLGRLGEISGDMTLAAAEADTILKKDPTHLLGLILASHVARARNDTQAQRRYLDALLKAEPAERARQRPEYLLHQNDITEALVQARQK